MKTSPRSSNRRPPEVHADDELVLQLPELRLLRVIARSVLLAAALLCFPWLRVVFRPEFLNNAAGAVDPKWVDDPFSLPMLIGDLKRQGLFAPGCNALFLGDPSSRRFFLKKNRIDPVTEFVKPAIGDRSIDFLLAAEGVEDSAFGFVDRVVKVGGIVAVRLGLEPSKFFHLPANYRVVYIRRYGSTVVGIKKMSLANGGEFEDGDSVGNGKTGRRLLSVARSNMEVVLKGLESPFLEPPQTEEMKSKRLKFLPELMGENSLAAYPRRFFVDVGAADGIEKKRNLEWFEREYPKKGVEFEIVRLELVEGGVGVGGIKEWLENVREEDFVVMTAEVDVVEEMVRGNVVGLVDELFLQCNNQWGKTPTPMPVKKKMRAYWECLTLYGRVKDEGVAVHQHQWWE